MGQGKLCIKGIHYCQRKKAFQCIHGTYSPCKFISYFGGMHIPVPISSMVTHKKLNPVTRSKSTELISD